MIEFSQPKLWSSLGHLTGRSKDRGVPKSVGRKVDRVSTNDGDHTVDRIIKCNKYKKELKGIKRENSRNKCTKYKKHEEWETNKKKKKSFLLKQKRILQIVM